MSVLAVVAAVAAAVLLVASARSLLIGGLRHRLPSMPVPSAERDLKKRPLPRWIWIVGGCLVVLPVVALPFPIPLLVLVPCLVGYRLRHLATQRRDRRRARAVDAEIPQLLDLLAAGSSAGLAAPLALRRAADGLRGPLSDEVRMTTEAVELGARWRVELHAMSDRLDLPDLRRTVSVLTRTETLGSSLEVSDRGTRRYRSAGAASGDHRARSRGSGEDALPLGLPRPPRVPPPHGGARTAHHRAVDPLNTRR